MRVQFPLLHSATPPMLPCCPPTPAPPTPVPWSGHTATSVLSLRCPLPVQLLNQSVLTEASSAICHEFHSLFVSKVKQLYYTSMKSVT